MSYLRRTELQFLHNIDKAYLKDWRLSNWAVRILFMPHRDKWNTPDKSLDLWHPSSHNSQVSHKLKATPYGPIILPIFISIVGKYYIYIDGQTTLRASDTLTKSETTRQSEPQGVSWNHWVSLNKRWNKLRLRVLNDKVPVRYRQLVNACLPQLLGNDNERFAFEWREWRKRN